jgi:tRNA modification GTPase
VIDDSLLVRTGAARWEIHLHGGTAVTSAVSGMLRNLGVRILQGGEATSLGLFGGTLEAEVLVALGRARTMTAVRTLLAQPAAWRAWAQHWHERLAAAPGELWRFHAEVQWRLERSRTAMHLLVPPRVAIIGPPNAGKSTLANALLGRPVAITSDMPGTTRDWVDAEAVFRGKAQTGDEVEVAVTLVDTAGIRETTDALESESIVRTHAQARAADTIIVLFDATRAPTARELALATPRHQCPVIVAASKCDLAGVIPAPLAALQALPTSARSGTGLDALSARLISTLALDSPHAEPVAVTPGMQRVLESLVIQDTLPACQQALSVL